MNDTRRKEIDAIIATLQAAKDAVDASDSVGSVRDDEQSSFDNLPESLQNSDRGETSQAAIDALDSAIASIESAVSELDDAISSLEDAKG